MAGIAVVVALVAPGTAVSASRGSTIFGLLVLLLVATGGARRVGAACRRLAALLLVERVGTPAPSADQGGMFDRLGGRLRDGPSWRAVAYMVLKLPVAAFDLYALSFWAGLVNLPGT